jgi:hypothetical protein
MVFTGYLLSGILFIANLAGNLMALKAEHSIRSMKDLKFHLKDSDLYELILKSHKIQGETLKVIDSSRSSFAELCSYVPMFDKPSRIFNTNEKVKNL